MSDSTVSSYLCFHSLLTSFLSCPLLLNAELSECQILHSLLICVFIPFLLPFFPAFSAFNFIGQFILPLLLDALFLLIGTVLFRAGVV